MHECTVIGDITVTMKLIEGKASLTKAIASIAKRVKTLDEDLHTVACSTLAHYAKHGDATYLSKLCKAVSDYKVVDGKAKWSGKSVRGAALRKWIEEFAPLTWSTDEYDGAGGYKTKKTANPKDTRLQQAMAVPFYDYTKDNIVELKPTAAAKSLRDRVRKILTEGKSESGKTTLAQGTETSARNLINALTDYLRREEGLDAIATEAVAENPGKIEAMVEEQPSADISTNDDSTIGKQA